MLQVPRCSFQEGYIHEHERLEPENAWKEKLQTPSCQFSGFTANQPTTPWRTPPQKQWFNQALLTETNGFHKP